MDSNEYKNITFEIKPTIESNFSSPLTKKMERNLIE